jgi:hypothetical protein
MQQGNEAIGGARREAADCLTLTARVSQKTLPSLL